MKYILKFDRFNLIKEADETAPVTEAPAPDPSALPTDNQVDDTKIEPEIQKRNSAVVLKEFLTELRGHIIYWMKYGDISNILTASNSDITTERRGICVWAEDVDEKYMWKIKFLEPETQGKIERIEKLLLAISVYDNNKENILKSKEIIIPIDDMNEDYLISAIKDIKGAILKVPKKVSDVKKFKKGEKDSLTDDIY